MFDYNQELGPERLDLEPSTGRTVVHEGPLVKFHGSFRFQNGPCSVVFLS